MILKLVRLAALLICIFLSSCAVEADVSDSEIELCIALICEEHRPCQVVLSSEACYSDGSSTLCSNKDCAEGSECRFGTCVSPDLDGAVCEADTDCARDRICVLDYCTEVEDPLYSFF